MFKGRTLPAKLERLGVLTLGDLLWFPPRRMYRWGELTAFSTLTPGTEVTVFALVMSQNLGWTRRHDKAMLTVVLQDELPGSPDAFWGGGQGRLTVRFFAKHPQALSLHAKRLEKGTLAVFSGKLTGKITGRASDAFLAHPEYRVLPDYDPEEARTLSTRPQPLYHTTAGLPSWKIERLIASQVALLGEVPEAIPERLRSQRDLPSAEEALRWLHHPETTAEHERALEYLKAREALTLGAALAKAKQRFDSRQAWPLLSDAQTDIGEDQPLGAKGSPSFSKSTLLETVIRSLPFTLTENQQQVWQEILRDVGKTHPMNRLLQGEVGSGKTVLAALALVLAVQNGHQAAFLAPTEVLAHQHFETLGGLLGGVLDVHLFTGSTPPKEKRSLSESLAAGTPMLVVGTHAMLGQNTRWGDLALTVVDEQHRFGVEQRMRLLAWGEHAPHYLAMSATPIPRTVAMTVYGDLEVSTLRELPRGRGEVRTFLVPEKNARWMSRMWARAREEIDAGGRVYVLCPKIAPDQGASGEDGGESILVTNEELEEGRQLHTVVEVASRLEAMPLFAGITIARAHSQLDSSLKQSAVTDFAQGKAPLLVSTTVIEVGMNVPEASMMIILDADRFGLSTLHQLRGRIGRGTRPGVCLAVAPVEMSDPLAREPARSGADLAQNHAKTSGLTASPAQARLAAFASTQDGFALAEEDLRIRREGDVLGEAQAGKATRLKVLSLLEDAEVITWGKNAAQELLAEDPELADNPELARLVFELGGSENLLKA